MNIENFENCINGKLIPDFPDNAVSVLYNRLRRELKCPEKNLPFRHFVYQKSHLDSPRMKPGRAWWEASQLYEEWMMEYCVGLVTRRSQVMDATQMWQALLQVADLIGYVSEFAGLLHLIFKVFSAWELITFLPLQEDSNPWSNIKIQDA